MRGPLLAGALSYTAAYTAQVATPSTPSWALASNAVPHWSNPVRSEPGFGLGAVDPALSMALKRQSGIDADGNGWLPGQHRLDDGHDHMPPKYKHNHNHNNKQHKQRLQEGPDHEKEHAQQEHEHEQQEHFDSGAWKPEGADQAEAGEQQGVQQKEDLQFECAAVDAERTDDRWCAKNCNTDPPYCPPDLCSCNGEGLDAVAGLPSVPAVPVGQAPAPSPMPVSTLDNCEGAECAGLGAGAGLLPEKKMVECIAVAAHCMPCGEPVPAVGGCNKNFDQTGCQADQCEWLGEFGPGCQSGESVDTGIGDEWCVESCNAEPANCPEEKCKCEGGNPMINNAGVERPPGMSKKANEIWTENEEKKAFSEREAVAKAEEVKRGKIEEETRKRAQEREVAAEKAREDKEEVTNAKAAADQKERDDGVTDRQTQADERNQQAMSVSKAAEDKITKSADVMKAQADMMKAVQHGQSP